eukprot:TRINITY_DN42910_c0_g1_i1.p1 TRINITY_DN42910_c0_g1~~TRINITY_DN42910_c0_g1_i1.p1  ORF type:complete len:521 (+),score=61.36 TRINITY_DN42910_c0_g1_i1:53-1564(+)
MAAAAVSAVSVGGNACSLRRMLSVPDAYGGGYLIFSGEQLAVHSAGILSPVEGQQGWEEKLRLASNQYRGCVKHARGRYWGVQLGMTHNLSFLGGPAAIDSRVRGRRFVPGGPNSTSMGICSDRTRGCSNMIRAVTGLCFPDMCTAREVRALLFPMLWHRGLLERPLLKMYQRHGLRIEIAELGEWAEFDLRWVVIGNSGSGTSSLTKGLHNHPQFEAVFSCPRVYEENAYLISRHHHPWHLPLRVEIDRFLAWRTKIEGPRPPFRGVKYGDYLRSDALLARLKEMPAVKAVAIVEDPVRLAEARWLKNHAWCRKRTRKSNVPLLSCLSGYRCAPICMPNQTKRAREKGFKLHLENFFFAARLQKAAEELGPERLFLVERESLAHGRVVFDKLVHFIGADAFPANVVWPTGKGIEANSGNFAPGRRLTHTLRQEYFSMDPSAMRLHSNALLALRDFFELERKVLKRLFTTLPSSGMPAWLRDDYNMIRCYSDSRRIGCGLEAN